MDYKPDENDQITKWLLPYDSHGPSEHGLKLTEMQWIEAEQKRIRFPTEARERWVTNPNPKDTVMIKEISLWRVNQNHSI